MNAILSIFIPALVALFCTTWIYPHFLKLALTKNIVDNPDARKLQRVPVPVMGGLTVVFGIMAGIMSFKYIGSFYDMFPIFTSIIIIMIVGFIDDTISLSPKVRFIIEIILILYIIGISGREIDNFQGLWGLTTIPRYISIPLTIFASVGIINAINLIDGVDGYSSGYTIISCILLGLLFYAMDNIRMATLAAIVASSLIPFFLHNVFGKYSKMFIGDAGTLSLGIIFSIFVMNILTTNSQNAAIDPNLGLVPFTLAVMCVPIFDTVRVMTMRIIRKKSPFSADKTHLHHLFIELGFSHFGTTVSIISMNIMVVLCWFIAYKIGLSIDVQLYIVIALGILITFVFYPVTQRHIRKQTKVYEFLHKIGLKTQVTDRKTWKKIQKFVDVTTSKEIKEMYK
ncbi:MAG: undecaprenyl/decaprenyl-phosphate alpha-N-acetylglucosaminyl 1-phosphate transferase [Bacteroidaceae bacterium]|nr:undecaprenyl/decaprenyl-phosphate alpha-N-acetylglucosaminyl 1-phosphate transferase [Bacteroidaceae bacterium]